MQVLFVILFIIYLAVVGVAALGALSIYVFDKKTWTASKGKRLGYVKKAILWPLLFVYQFIKEFFL